MKARFAVALLVALVSATTLVADDSADTDPGGDDKKKWYRRGDLRLGAFVITNIDTTISLFSQRNPLGARISLDKDLGFSDSHLAPRVTLGYAFGKRKRHLMSGSWFNIKRESRKELSIVIPLPPGEEFPIGATVESQMTTEIFKTQYTWMFHQDRKVSLGLGAGLFIARLRLEIDGEGPFDIRRFSESVSAPLPVAGLRLTYSLTSRWKILSSADWFFINYDKYSGVMTDWQTYVHHRTTKHVGFAAGVNLFVQKAEYDDDDLLWEVNQSFVGILAAATFVLPYRESRRAP